MVIHHLRIFADQELAANREARILFGLRNAGFLQQGQRRAAGADKDKFGFNDPLLTTVVGIREGHRPALVGVALEATHHGTQLQGEIIMLLQAGDQLAGNFAIVDVRSHFSTGGSHLLLRIAAFHHQRRPGFDLLMVFRIANTAEQFALLQRRIARTQEVDVIFAPHKAHVRHTVNERFWFVQDAARHLMRPELTRDMEGFVDVDRFVDIDAVGGLRRVVQLH